jgi:two-component system chemotaxis response regulator CheY
MGTKVLIADDDESIRDAIKTVLQKNGFEVLEAKNGSEAIEIAKKTNVRLVLMDVEMPIVNGIDATKRLLQINPEAIVIGITVFKAEKGEEMFNAGAREVIAKSFSPRELLKAIRKIA